MNLQHALQESFWTAYAADLGYKLERGDYDQGGYWLSHYQPTCNNTWAQWCPDLLAVQMTLTNQGGELIEIDPSEVSALAVTR